jgi:hypothetical protein
MEEAIIEGAEKTRAYDGRSTTNRKNPMQREWVLTAIGDSSKGVRGRLLAVAQGMISEMPPSLKDSVEISLRPYHVLREGWHFDIRGEGTAVIIGILMAAAGWLGAACCGKSRAGPVVGTIPVFCALILSLLPADWQAHWGAIVPAQEPKRSPELTLAALKSLSSGEDDGGAASALSRWVNACLRLDREAAERLADGLTAADWKQKASFWMDNHLLAVKQSPRVEGEELKDVTFDCLVAPMDDSGMSGESTATRRIIRVRRKGEAWTVSQ